VLFGGERRSAGRPCSRRLADDAKGGHALPIIPRRFATLTMMPARRAVRARLTVLGGRRPKRPASAAVTNPNAHRAKTNGKNAPPPPTPLRSRGGQGSSNKSAQERGGLRVRPRFRARDGLAETPVLSRDARGAHVIRYDRARRRASFDDGDALSHRETESRCCRSRAPPSRSALAAPRLFRFDRPLEAALRRDVTQIEARARFHAQYGKGVHRRTLSRFLPFRRPGDVIFERAARAGRAPLAFAIVGRRRSASSTAGLRRPPKKTRSRFASAKEWWLVDDPPRARRRAPSSTCPRS